MIAVLGDIHGNLEALKTVIKFIHDNQINVVFMTGDLVDYGADSVGVIEEIYNQLVCKKVEIYSCRGNHDDFMFNPDLAKFNTSHAYQSYYKTFKELYDPNIQPWIFRMFCYFTVFLRKDLNVNGRDVLICHCQEDSPINNSIKNLTPINEKETIQVSEEANIIFTGHSHIQGYKTEGNKIYINPGSVGQPRNGDPRAQFLVCDDSLKNFQFIRLEYDIKKAADKITESGRPRFLSTRLFLGI